MAFKKSTTVNFGGDSYSENASVDTGRTLGFNETQGKAQAGTLSVRTSNSVGTLVMGAAAVITTGARFDLYWSAAGVIYHRRGCTAGTVSGTSVPFTGGSGDNLPIATTVIQAVMPTVTLITVTASAVLAFVLASQKPGLFVITDASDAEIFYVLLQNNNSVYVWYTGCGIATPLSGTIGKVYMSHNYTSDPGGVMKGAFGAS